jgi:guanylate kinase
VVAGPSGVGKGTIVRRVLELVPGLQLSVSVTTRLPRASLGERNGVDYFFVTPDEFEELVLEGGLLEWAELFGKRYGTPRAWVQDALAAGQDVVLEIDVQGAQQIRDSTADAVLIFLDPPSIGELERRLRTRGSEDEDKLADRLAKADWEREQQGWFDHVVVNDDVERASSQVAAIIESSRSSPGRSASSTDGSMPARSIDGSVSEGNDHQ